MSYGAGCRHGLGLALLWLGCRPAAVPPIGPLAWESPYAMGVALQSKKKKNHLKAQTHSLTIDNFELLPLK